MGLNNQKFENLLYEYPAFDTWKSLKPILHYAFGLRFGNVCEHKHEKNARKMWEKRKWLAFLTNASCNIEHFLILGNFLVFHSRFYYITLCFG